MNKEKIITATAILKSVNMSAKKGNLFIYRMRTAPVQDMVSQLLASDRKAAELILKAVRQCIANWKVKLKSIGLDWMKTNPMVHVRINRAKKLPRSQPRARGRSDRTYKHYSHVCIEMYDEKVSMPMKEVV